MVVAGCQMNNLCNLGEIKIMQTNYKKIESIFLVILVIIYFTWFLFFINKGIDITDSAYILTLYKYIFEPETSTTIGFAMSSILGGIIWKIIPDGQVLILSIISAFLYAIDGLLIYSILKQYISKIILFIMILGVSFFSISWFHVLHYNSWSMFFLTLEIYFLYQWFKNTNVNYLCICGIIYGFNIWIRIPNCVHGICIIAIVWYIVNKKEKCLWRHVGIMLLAAMLSFLITTIFVAEIVGANNLIDGIINIFLIGVNTSDQGNGHSFISMFTTIGSYLQHGFYVLIKYVSKIIIICLVEYVLSKIYTKIVGRSISLLVTQIISIILGISFGIYTYIYSYANESALSFYIVLSIGLSGIGAFKFCRRDLVLSSLCVINFFLELTIMLGTDNSVLWNIVFLYFPMGMIGCLCVNLFGNKFKNFGKVFLIFIDTLVIIGGIQYATTYVYRDAEIDQLKYSIQAVEDKGIKTSVERATFINNLVENLKGLPDGEILCMGDCVIASVISDLKPSVKAWPDVDSYSYEQFCMDIDKKIKDGNMPYILIYDGEEEVSDISTKKLRKIEQIITLYHYKKLYTDAYFTIYSPS